MSIKRLKDYLYENLLLESDDSEEDDVKKENKDPQWTPLENFIIDIKKADLSKSIHFDIDGNSKFFRDYLEEDTSEDESGLILNLQDEESESGQDSIIELFKKMTEDKYTETDNITFYYNKKYYQFESIKETSSELIIYII